MADGDGGGGGSGRMEERVRPELVYQGRALNPSPLATAMPLPPNFPAFHGGSVAPRPVLWHSAPRSVPYPVSIPPVYFTHPPPMPPMEFPSFKLDLPSGLMPLPVFHGTPQPQPQPQPHPHPRSSSSNNHHLPSAGTNEGRVSFGDRITATSNITIPVPPAKSGQSSLDKSELERHLFTPVNKSSVDKSELERLFSTPVNKSSFELQRPLSTPVNENSAEAERYLSTPVNKVPCADSPSSDVSPLDLSSEPPPVPESYPRVPVPQCGRGEGWPYAPQGWPHAEDKWGWRVGKRASGSALWVDRYVTVPASLVKGKRLAYKTEFASRKSLVEYLRQNFPQMKDPHKIFKAFDWKIPAPKDFEGPEKRGSSVKRDKPSLPEREEDEHKAKKRCQAGNPHCKASYTDSEPLLCNICCSEPSFCRNCKCVLCCKFFSPDADNYSVIRCLNSPTSAQGICGHASHLECALEAQLAGVVRKIGLDMEYMCRRCDRRTDLKDIVGRLVCEFMSKTATEEKVESSLQLLLRVVQDPEEEGRSSGKVETTLIGALKKVQEGADLAESCKELTAELLELRSGRSRAMGRRRERTPDAETGAATTSDLDMNKDLPGTAPSVARVVDQVPAVSVEEHIRQCEAMANRVKGAGQLGTSLLSFSLAGTLEVVLGTGSGPRSGTAGDFRTPQEHHQVGSPEAQASSHNRGAEEQGHSACLFNTHGHVANVHEVDEVEDAFVHNNEGAKSAMEDGNKSTKEAGGDDTASTKRTPPMSTSTSGGGAKDTIPTPQIAGADTSAGLEAEFEEQISEALAKLKRAQEREYGHAEEMLNCQKKVVVDQYRELESVMGKPHENHKPRAEFEWTMNQLMAQYGKAQQGQSVFETMLGISKGFGHVSKEFLREFLRWPPSHDAEA